MDDGGELDAVGRARSGNAPPVVRPERRAGAWARRADGTPFRLVADPAAGRTWRVSAVACAHVPGARAADCLLFDAGDVVRRVWGVPAGWAALSDDALLALVVQRPP
ncbi:hypothetical protein tb265_07010 [Gemmatimonadetes bacterium T265]|nr:hypothetical protein tb265_07010 [Gemmatimonadetes bacterium T265]